MSHDPGAAGGPDSRENAWLELLVDGLTFDLLGLAPGPALELPAIQHRFELDGDFHVPDFEAIGLFPGPHLSGASRALPVVRAMAELTAHLAAEIENAIAVVWGPSGSVMGGAYFRAVAGQWAEGGAFPALGLTGLEPLANGKLRSDGLSFFIGQEVEIAADLAEDRVAGSRLAIRAIDVLIEHGRLDDQIGTSGIDGAPLVLAPSADGSIVRVRRQ